MDLQLTLSPAGRLTAVSTDHGKATSVAKTDLETPKEKPKLDAKLQRLINAFANSNSEGLFALASSRLDPSLSPIFGCWRDFAASYITEICQVPEGVDADIGVIRPPTGTELEAMILGLPPMPGAEYLSRNVLQGIWGELDDWFRTQVKSSGQGLAAFLKDRAPVWSQVGRVCFHLAENKRDDEYPFAFLATYATTASSGGRIQYQPLSKALQHYAGKKNNQALIKLLAPVQSAFEFSSLIRDLVDTGDIYEPLAWTPQAAYEFLKDVPHFEECGITVRLPDWWKKRPRPQARITIGGQQKRDGTTGGLLDFQIQVAIGDEKLTEDEWQELLRGSDGLTLFRGQWVEVDRAKLEEALDHWKKVEEAAKDGLSFNEGMRLLAGAPADLADDLDDSKNDWSFVDAGQWLRKVLEDLRHPEQLTATQPGSALKATLREYQETGVNWLAFLSSLGLGACLADDMGLGKTIQIVALLLILKKKKVPKPSLLVLPASLMGNWKSEIERFAPSLTVRFVHASLINKSDLEQLASDPRQALRGTDVVITTYGMLLRQPWLLESEWQLAVLDEAQAIKNPSARQTKAVKKLKSVSRIALTGTPVENRLGDLWSLFDFLCPGLLGSAQKFSRFIKRLESRERDRYAPLRRLVGPYILRRLKTDKSVIADLPDKTEVQTYCGLTKRQAVLYKKLVDEFKNTLQKQHEGIQRRGLVLSYLMRFKQLCNHPSQMLGDGQFEIGESGKLIRLTEICEEIASRQEKVLVFTQFREMTDPLSSTLASAFGRGGLVLHGGTPVKHRKKLVDDFQQDDGPPFFVLSLKAGGTGLNLTAASHVVHFDRWWNPAVENQATDRAFRIGQKRNVLVHKFVCQGTIEERIDSMIAEKTELANELLEGGEKMLTEMSDAELIEMVTLDVERVNL